MDDLLHCPKCQERFGESERKPKLLQCHHTYCLGCLQELQTRKGSSKKSSKSVTCPACSKVTTVGKKGVTSLQDNFYITTFRSTLDMQAASETESAVDDIYISDEEDQQALALPPENVDDWCKTCKRVAVPSCKSSNHNMCNLSKMIQELLVQFGDLVMTQLETREPVLHALQSAELALLGVLHGLQEDISSQDMLLSMAHSEKQWLLAVDLSNKTTSTLSDRFGKLDLQMSAAINQLERAKATSNNFLGLQRAVLRVDFGNCDEEKQSVTLDVGGDTDNEKTLRYLIYRMMQAKKLNVPDVKPKEDVGGEEEWKEVGREKMHKGNVAVPRVRALPAVTITGSNSHPSMKHFLPAVNTSLPAAFTKPPQISVHSVGKAVSVPVLLPCDIPEQHPGLQPVPAGHPTEPVSSRQPTERREKSLVMVKSIPSSTHSYRCFFEIEVNGKSIGTILMLLRPDVAPKMCFNFVALCRGELGYGYKGSKIFKVHSNSFVVGGDFENNDGSGGYSIYNKGYFLGDDSNLPDSHRAVRMRGMGTDLKTGCGKVGSQFHIWVGDKEFKEYKKTLVFGHVIKGMEILEYISNFKTIRSGDGDYILKSAVVIRNCGTI